VDSPDSIGTVRSYDFCAFLVLAIDGKILPGELVLDGVPALLRLKDPLLDKIKNVSSHDSLVCYMRCYLLIFSSVGVPA
jgi:hypothetical protein